jgi:omega-6 fatty acid desaturase (delta-12 desaturase)
MFFLLKLKFPYWSVLLVAIPAAGFYIRTFRIVHDCSHSSFLNSRKLGFVLGHFCGIITLTPFFDWQRNHGIHHANVANLDKRGTGDIRTMTFQEYASAGLLSRVHYRCYRNPFFLFLIAPPLLFAVLYRFPQKSTRRRDYFSIAFTDVILVLIILTVHHTVGLSTYFAAQLPIVLIATPIGMWLFYIQHQFKNVYWAHQENWDLITAAVYGASFYKLPGLLRWITENIGYHNLHHLKPRIPCYRLKQCYDNVPELHYIEPITLATGFRSLHLHLWDEKTKKLISFKEAKQKIKAAAPN